MGVIGWQAKSLSEEIGQNEHAHSVRFSRTMFLNLGGVGDLRQHLGQENRYV